MAAPLSATRTASTSDIRAAKSSITQEGSGNYKSNPVSSFFSTLTSDIKMGLSGPEARNYGGFTKMYNYKTPRELRRQTQIDMEKERAANRDGDNRRATQAVRYSPPPPPIKSIEDYYNMLKGPVEPLPSLTSKKSQNYKDPVYANVDTTKEKTQRDGGETRSFFQSASTGYV